MKTKRFSSREPFLIAAVLLLLMIFAQAINAEVNLPATCPDSLMEGQSIGTCSFSSQQFVRADANTLVRVCDSESCNMTGQLWRRFGDVAANEFVEVCTADKAPGSQVGGGECQGNTSSAWGAMAKVPPSEVAQVVTELPGTFDVSPASGVSPLDLTIAWDVPGMGSGEPCVASGDWSGGKSASGTESLTVTEDSEFSLTCSTEAGASTTARLSWTAPTTNEDGSPLTDLAGFRIVYGNDPDVLHLTHQIDNPGMVSYVFDDLASGTWFFGVKAFTESGAESVTSNIVSKAISSAPSQTFSATRSVNVVPRPSAPTGLTVEEVVAYEIVLGEQSLVARAIGLVPLGALCGDRQQHVDGVTYTQVERTLMDAVEFPMGDGASVWAVCGGTSVQ